jgi:hypothetical protein
MSDELDFFEAEAKENAAFHIACAETLMREANTFLNLLLAGAGGALALMVTLAEKLAPTWQIFGTAATSAYLFLLAGLLLLKCLRVRPIYPPANEPKNLMQDGFSLEQIRRAEMKARQTCIDINRIRNDAVGLWLNRCRGMTAATPLIFLAVAAAVAAC